MIRKAISIVLVVSVLPVWAVGFAVEVLWSAFLSGRKAYVYFYDWLGGH